jgi:hypothetical protein
VLNSDRNGFLNALNLAQSIVLASAHVCVVMLLMQAQTLIRVHSASLLYYCVFHRSIIYNMHAQYYTVSSALTSALRALSVTVLRQR